MKKGKTGFNIIILVAIFILTIVISVTKGSANITVSESFKLILNKVPGIRNLISISEIKSVYETIVWKIRMPRIVMAAIVGGSLSITGAAYQAIFRNPMADPHVLGVSSGAALGATIGMLTGASTAFLGLGIVGVCAFIGAIVTVLLVYSVSHIGGIMSTNSLLLTGIAMSTMLSAIISILMLFNNRHIEKVYMWTMGSFTAATMTKNGFVLIFLVVAAIGLFIQCNKLNIMLTGEETAKSLGVDTETVRKSVIILASLLVAAVVSVSGIIGFVGLIIPHCVRLIFGADNKKVMGYGIIIGATFMVICDTVARTVVAPIEIPVGVITSIIGAPYFVILIIYQKTTGKRGI